MQAEEQSAERQRESGLGVATCGRDEKFALMGKCLPVSDPENRHITGFSPAARDLLTNFLD